MKTSGRAAAPAQPLRAMGSSSVARKPGWGVVQQQPTALQARHRGHHAEAKAAASDRIVVLQAHEALDCLLALGNRDAPAVVSPRW